MVYNGYYKVSNRPKMGQLPTPEETEPIKSTLDTLHLLHGMIEMIVIDCAVQSSN